MMTYCQYQRPKATLSATIWLAWSEPPNRSAPDLKCSAPGPPLQCRGEMVAKNSNPARTLLVRGGGVFFVGHSSGEKIRTRNHLCRHPLQRRSAPRESRRLAGDALPSGQARQSRRDWLDANSGTGGAGMGVG